MNRLDWVIVEYPDDNGEVVTYHSAVYKLCSQNIIIVNLEFQITEIDYLVIDDWVVSAAVCSIAEEEDKYISLNDDCLSLSVAKQICEDWLDKALEDLKSQI